MPDHQSTTYDLPSDTDETPHHLTTVKPRDWFQIGFYFMLGVAGASLVTYIGAKLFLVGLNIVAPFAIGLFLAMLLDPLVVRLGRRGLPRIGAVAIVFIGFFAIVSVVVTVIIPIFAAQASKLADNGPLYVAALKSTVDYFLKHHRHIGTIKLPRNFDALSIQMSGQVSAFLKRSAGDITSFVIGSLSTLVEGLVVLIVAFYLLIDIDRLRARFFYLVPKRFRTGVAEIGADIGQIFTDYLRGLFTVCSFYGLTMIAMLYGLAYCPGIGKEGMAQYALLVGVSAGVLYAIPYFGAVTINLVTFLVAFAAGGVGFGVTAVIGAFIVNQVFDNVVTPRVVGGGVGINPVVSLFSLAFGGSLFGFWGLLISVPVAASVQILLLRIFPKLQTPTPPSFLRAQGVRESEGATTQIMDKTTPELKAKQESDKADTVERTVNASREE